MTKEIKRGVPFREIRVKLGYQIPSWEKVSEKISISENHLSKRELRWLRRAYTSQVKIALKRVDEAQEIMDELEADEELYERFENKLDAMAKLIRRQL